MAVKILVDSAADISLEDAKKLDVTIVPLIITFDGEDYYDGKDITPLQFYEKLVASANLPKTSQVSPFRFEEVYEKLTENGDEVVVITISSKLSGTYASAVTATERFAGKVFVVDSLNATIGERLLCEYAVRLAKEGELSAREIAVELEEKKTKIRLLALVGTLEYLKKGGRISAAVAFAGEVLSLKPAISIVEGEVKLVGKALGYRKGNILLNNLISKTNGIDLSMPYGAVWSGADKTALDKYAKDSEKFFVGAESMPAYIIGATIGTHVGPGAYGVAFFEK